MRGFLIQPKEWKKLKKKEHLKICLIFKYCHLQLFLPRSSPWSFRQHCVAHPQVVTVASQYRDAPFTWQGLWGPSCFYPVSCDACLLLQGFVYLSWLPGSQAVWESGHRALWWEWEDGTGSVVLRQKYISQEHEALTAHRWQFSGSWVPRVQHGCASCLLFGHREVLKSWRSRLWATVPPALPRRHWQSLRDWDSLQCYEALGSSGVYLNISEMEDLGTCGTARRSLSVFCTVNPAVSGLVYIGTRSLSLSPLLHLIDYVDQKICNSLLQPNSVRLLESYVFMSDFLIW